MGPGVGGAPPGAPPQLPGSVAGGTGGPGATPMVSPGGGAGNKAAAIASIKAVMKTLQVHLLAFEPGSRESQALMRSLSALNPIFGKAQDADLTPAAMRQMAQTQNPGGPLSAAPPPGIAPAALPPMPPTAGMGGEM